MNEVDAGLSASELCAAFIVAREQSIRDIKAKLEFMEFYSLDESKPFTHNPNDNFEMPVIKGETMDFKKNQSHGSFADSLSKLDRMNKLLTEKLEKENKQCHQIKK